MVRCHQCWPDTSLTTLGTTETVNNWPGWPVRPVNWTLWSVSWEIYCLVPVVNKQILWISWWWGGSREESVSPVARFGVSLMFQFCQLALVWSWMKRNHKQSDRSSCICMLTRYSCGWGEEMYNGWWQQFGRGLSTSIITSHFITFMTCASAFSL